MKKGSLGIGSLCRWAKIDNPEEFDKLRKIELEKYLEISYTGSENLVARALYQMYRYQFVCANIKHKIWYEYSNHRWELSEEGINLRMKLSNELRNEYIQRAAYYGNKAIESENEDKEIYLKKKKKFDDIINKLGSSTFKKNVMTEAIELFYHSDFITLLDGNKYLLGFENGVFDLKNYEFRDGRPEDYISLSTGIDYIEYEEDSEMVQKIYQVLEQIQPNNEMRSYILCLLASCLSGQIREQRFHIWTGVGSNGKSILIDLFDKALGKYTAKLPISLLTSKRAASNSASPELARTKGRRFVVLQEPEDKVQMNVGLMKELSGGDTIQARDLFAPIKENLLI